MAEINKERVMDDIKGMTRDFTVQDGAIVANNKEEKDFIYHELRKKYNTVHIRPFNDRNGVDKYRIHFKDTKKNIKGQDVDEGMEKKVINIREELNRLDYETNCQYDLINLYEAAELDSQARKDLVKFLAQGEDADFIGNFLSQKYGAKCSDDLCEETFAESRDEDEFILDNADDMGFWFDEVQGDEEKEERVAGVERQHLRKSSAQKDETLTESGLRIDDYDVSDREKLTVGWDKDKGFVVAKIWRPTTDTNTWRTEWERTYSSEEGAKRAFKRYVSKLSENLSEAKDTERSRANRRDKISGKFDATYTLTLKNQYNYTVIQYRIDPKNKTIEKGLFNWGDGKGSFFKNRKELQRHIDDLLAQGYKMVESKDESLTEDAQTKTQTDECQTIDACLDDNRKALVISKEEWEDRD